MHLSTLLYHMSKYVDEQGQTLGTIYSLEDKKCFWLHRTHSVTNKYIVSKDFVLCIFNACLSLSTLVSGNFLLSHIFHAGISPNYSTFSWLVDGYCNQNNEAEVLSIPDDIMKRGFCVDKSVYRSLIRRFCKRDLVDYAQKIYVNMQVKGIPGDSLVYTILSYAYLSAGKPIAASEMLNNMVKNKLMITSKIYRCLCASYADRSEMLEVFWLQAIEKGLIARNVYKLMKEVWATEWAIIEKCLPPCGSKLWMLLFHIKLEGMIRCWRVYCWKNTQFFWYCWAVIILHFNPNANSTCLEVISPSLPLTP